jgi:hypothetical protein
MCDALSAEITRHAALPSALLHLHTVQCGDTHYSALLSPFCKGCMQFGHAAIAWVQLVLPQLIDLRCAIGKLLLTQLPVLLLLTLPCNVGEARHAGRKPLRWQ